MPADDKIGQTGFVTGTEGAQGLTLGASLNFCRGWLVR